MAVKKRQARAVSTGEAAKYCFVTPDTIVNWIRSDRIRAQRTAGGQYRILLNDLREFMEDCGMNTDLFDSTYDFQRFCWECRLARSRDKGDSDRCNSCIVKFLAVLNCFRFMGLQLSANHRKRDCADCDYFKRWGGSEADHLGEGEVCP